MQVFRTKINHDSREKINCGYKECLYLNEKLPNGVTFKTAYINYENIIEKALADNVEIIQPGSCNKRVNLQFVLESLASDFSCNEVLIEAGPSLSGAFIETGLVDELILYIAPKILGSDGKPL